MERQLWLLLPIIAVMTQYHSIGKLPEELGFNKKLVKGIGYGLLFSIPALAFFYFLGGGIRPITRPAISRTLSEGFTQQLFFSAFVVGQLVRYGQWRFSIAAFLSATLAGIYATNWNNLNVAEFDTFLVPFLTSLLFSWLFVKWSFNLWLAGTMQFLWNLYREVANGHQELYYILVLASILGVIAVAPYTQSLVAKRRVQIRQ